MLIDFNIAEEKMDESLLKMNFKRESINFWAPEIVSMHPNTNTGIDIWSATVIIYMLLCHEMPFHGIDDKQI